MRAAAIVAEKFQGTVEFLCAGEDESHTGAYRANVESLIAELGLSERVRLLGRLKDSDALIASLDILVSASRSEAFGMTMVEAMACGVPVVATATEGTKEIVNDGTTGLIVPIGDVSALSAAIVSLLEDEDRRLALGAHSRDWARARFDLERMIEMTERVYAEALRGASRVRS